MEIKNTYYDYLVHEVQTVLNCDRGKAMEVVALVNGMGGDPVEFIHRLPGLLGTPEPDADELLVMLQEVRKEQEDTKNYIVCFPKDYQNRAARRKKKKTKGKSRARRL